MYNLTCHILNGHDSNMFLNIKLTLIGNGGVGPTWVALWNEVDRAFSGRPKISVVWSNE